MLMPRPDGNSRSILHLAASLADLVERFRKDKSAKDFKWWNNNYLNPLFRSRPGFPDCRALFDKVVLGVVQLNPEMLSESEVQKTLVFDFIARQTADLTVAEHVAGEHLVASAQHELEQMTAFKAWHDVDVLVSHLRLEAEPVKLGQVTFVTPTEDDSYWWRKHLLLERPQLPDAWVIARVRVPGDHTKALQTASGRVEEALEVFRGLRFPFVGRFRDAWQVGLVGNVADHAPAPMRIDGQLVYAGVGYAAGDLDLEKDIVPKLQQHWEAVSTVLQKPTLHRSEMETKLLLGIHWLSDATKPDTNQIKLAKIAFALEALIGGEPKAEGLSVRGITAMLAERAAFLAGKDPTDRLKVDKDIRDYYRLRGAIVHGESKGTAVSNETVDGFGELVRRTALALLQELAHDGTELRTAEDLERWARNRRFGVTYPVEWVQRTP